MNGAGSREVDLLQLLVGRHLRDHSELGHVADTARTGQQHAILGREGRIDLPVNQIAERSRLVRFDDLHGKSPILKRRSQPGQKAEKAQRPRAVAAARRRWASATSAPPNP